MKKAKAGIHLDNKVTIEHRNAAGDLLYREEGHNVVTDLGFDWLCAQIGGTALNVSMHWIAVSLSVAADDPTHTTLASEFTDDGMERASATYAHSAGAQSKIFTLSKTFTKGAGAAKVAGKTALFNQLAVGGIMLAEYLIGSPPTLLDTDTLAITWTVTLS
jgi:hypothetical protein